MATIVEALTRDIVERDLRKESSALVKKWENTGLLESIGTERDRVNMSLLLENQAKQLLREASTMSGGDVEGFASVAFPIVRRVFGGLIANELVSVQPMSLPSGLIFFLDFTFTNTRLKGSVAGESLYGGGVVGQQLTGGISLSNDNAEKSFYNLNNAYSSPTSSTGVSVAVVASASAGSTWSGSAAYRALGDKLIQYDPDLVANSTNVAVGIFSKANLTSNQWNADNYVAISGNISGDEKQGGTQVRRLTKDDTVDTSKVLMVLAATGSETVDDLSASLAAVNNLHFPIDDKFATAGAHALGAVAGREIWGLEEAPQESDGDRDVDFIPEIDIKVDSLSVTAISKKLKAKWTPELAQDLNAYHNLDAEVELTSILSEQIALEIDQEILEDLVKKATGATLYWSRHPGKFLNRESGADITSATAPPDYTGDVSKWYETLLETVNDASARIHRKTLRGGANFLVCSPEVASILEMTSGFRATVNLEEMKGSSAGAVKVGTLSRKWDVFVNPYFMRNVILIGRKGSSFLESGYVYAPYVPLQTTPTIFGVEDFVPRKGVMTRYAKKMVRPDMYGLVIVRDLV